MYRSTRSTSRLAYNFRRVSILGSFIRPFSILEIDLRLMPERYAKSSWLSLLFSLIFVKLFANLYIDMASFRFDLYLTTLTKKMH